ncbi:MAG: WD40 repeat domain-containing protein [Prosthecobacter sp.]|nr:WD40 repeat domain-containing protein [Prosthecobacter sp.]
MDDHRAIASASTACVFNYLTGEIIQSFKQASGHLTEDGQNFFLIKGDDRMPWASKSMTLTQVNLPTGEVTELGKRELKRPTGGQSGLIPGGRYFYIGHPGMFIYNLQTLELVAEKTFKGSDLLHTIFSPDGSQYVVLTSGRLFFNGQFPDHDAEKHGIIRLHDTLSGKLLWAALTPSRRMSDPFFSPDGQRLGSVADDGTILVWDVEE